MRILLKMNSALSARPSDFGSSLRCCLLGVLMGCLGGQALAMEPPNVIIIVADDLGWRDVGYHGSEIATPNIDRLAVSGVQLTQFYAQPTCSPTRASLMTGQAALRLGVLQPIDKNLRGGLPLPIVTLPQYFHGAGYETVMAGKWHLGHSSAEYLPMARGFEQAYGNMTGGVGYWDHVHGGGLDWHRDGKALREPGYATHLIAAEAIRLIDNRDQARPLFLYAAFNAPHLPNEAPDDTTEKYSAIESTTRRAHAAMVDELDQAIGHILAAVQRSGMDDDTLIWFISDNGGLRPGAGPPLFESITNKLTAWFGKPLPTAGGLEFIRSNIQDGGSDNGPYRRGKGSVYQGGVLVPSVLYWPGTLEARELDKRVTVQDVLPTLAQMASIPLTQDQALDGSSQWQAISTGQGSDTPDFVANGWEGEALYHQQWKLVADVDPPELYDLTLDDEEQNNLAANVPALVAELQARLADYPRGESIHKTPVWQMLLDMDAFGGSEDRLPWADRVEDGI